MKTVKRDRVRVGVVGCGVVASYGHIPAISRIAEAQIVGFADPDKARREAESAKYGAPAFATFEQMAASVELDAVSIPTHPNIKLDMIRIAAAKGLHAFCEKPLTDTIEQAEEIMRLMDSAGLFVGIAFVYRGKQTVQRMAELVREGAIGKLRAVHIENLWDYHGLRDAAERGNRRHRALENLGTLDCGVHDLDLGRYLSGGEYGRIQAVGTIVEKANRYPDHIAMHSVMSNGVLVTVEESAVWGYTAKERPVYEQSYRMVGEYGVLSVGFGDWGTAHQSATLRVVSGERQWSEQLTSDKAWDDTYRQFFQIILGREPAHRFIADGRDGLVNMRVAREVVAQCGA
jgi:predicted dehydrogenase